jgi:phage terminase small subunit
VKELGDHLCSLDQGIMELYVRSWYTQMATAKTLRKARWVSTATGPGGTSYEVVHPLVAVNAKAERVFMECCKRLGLDPQSRKAFHGSIKAKKEMVGTEDEGFSMDNVISMGKHAG